MRVWGHDICELIVILFDVNEKIPVCNLCCASSYSSRSEIFLFASCFSCRSCVSAPTFVRVLSPRHIFCDSFCAWAVDCSEFAHGISPLVTQLIFPLRFSVTGQALIKPIFCFVPVHSDLLLRSICCPGLWSVLVPDSRTGGAPGFSFSRLVSWAAVVNLHFSTDLLFTHPSIFFFLLTSVSVPTAALRFWFLCRPRPPV
jgi:hypothetical protein